MQELSSQDVSFQGGFPEENPSVIRELILHEYDGLTVREYKVEDIDQLLGRYKVNENNISEEKLKELIKKQHFPLTFISEVSSDLIKINRVGVIIKYLLNDYQKDYRIIIDTFEDTIHYTPSPAIYVRAPLDIVKISFEELKDYLFLSYDPLARHFVNNDCKKWNGIWLIKDKSTPEERREIIDNIGIARQQGYFTYSRSLIDSDKTLLKEIFSTWHIEIVSEYDDLFVLKMIIPSIIDKENWLKAAVQSIKLDELPRYNIITGHDDPVLTKYHAILDYMKTMKFLTKEMMITFIQRIYVDELSNISLIIPGYDLVKEFLHSNNIIGYTIYNTWDEAKGKGGFIFPHWGQWCQIHRNIGVTVLVTDSYADYLNKLITVNDNREYNVPELELYDDGENKVITVDGNEIYSSSDIIPETINQISKAWSEGRILNSWGRYQNNKSVTGLLTITSELIG